MTFSLILSRWEPEDYWVKYKWLATNFKQTLLAIALWCDYLTLSVLGYFETFGCWRHYIKHFPYHGDPKCYQNWLRSGFLQNRYVTLSIKLGNFCENTLQYSISQQRKVFPGKEDVWNYLQSTKCSTLFYQPSPKSPESNHMGMKKISFFEKHYSIDLSKSESLCNIQTGHITTNFLKAVLHTIFLVDCW